MVLLVSLTAIRAALVIVAARVVNAGKKSSVRISVVSHSPDVATGLFDGVFADDVFPCERPGSLRWATEGRGIGVPHVNAH